MMSGGVLGAVPTTIRIACDGYGCACTSDNIQANMNARMQAERLRMRLLISSSICAPESDAGRLKREAELGNIKI
jgi:hypothetical protein